MSLASMQSVSCFPRRMFLGVPNVNKDDGNSGSNGNGSCITDAMVAKALINIFKADGNGKSNGNKVGATVSSRTLAWRRLASLKRA